MHSAAILILCFVFGLTASYSVRGRSSLEACSSRYRMTQLQLFKYTEIRDSPYYVPDCDQDGYLWKQSQCDYMNPTTCFCVNRETGSPIPDTTRYDVIKEFMDCEGGEYATEIKSCDERAVRYREIEELHGVDHMFDYIPFCSPNGFYQALQRNDQFFFCVDTKTGEKIPGTQSERELPITIEICSSFSTLWQRYKIVLQHGKNEHIEGPNSCRLGTVYEECGCKLSCEPGVDMNTIEPVEGCEECRPMCRCPTGSYDLNGQCVSNEECMAANDHGNQQQQMQSWKEFAEDMFFQLYVHGEISRTVEDSGNHLLTTADPNYRRNNIIDGDHLPAPADYSGAGVEGGETPLHHLIKEYEYDLYDDIYEDLSITSEDPRDQPSRIPEEIDEYYEGEYESFPADAAIVVVEDNELFAHLPTPQYKKSVIRESTSEEY